MDVWNRSLAVVNACLARGIREFVVASGARNAALLEVLAKAEGEGRVKLWRHYDERSVGFFALGRTMATGEGCAVVVTSGTAAAELLPAVVEAYYQARGLVVLTADRPREFRGTGSPQTIEQVGIFGEYAPTFDEVEGLAEALEGWSGKCPFHANLSLEEAFEVGAVRWVAEQAWVTRRESLAVGALAKWLRTDVFRGLVVMLGGLEDGEREDVFYFCEKLGAPVVAEATSGLREALQSLSLSDPDRQLLECPPAKILRLGEVPSGRFWRDLENLPEVEVWSVCRNGLPGLSRVSEVLRSDVGRVLRVLGEVEEVGDALDYFERTSRREALREELLECWPDSEPALLRTVSLYASYGESLYLGNSMPIREWNLFGQWHRPLARVRANRGANGIDGQLSTWLGWSADEKNSWALVGDLTALYDVNAGGFFTQTRNEGRILVVMNNGGGKIFERVPRLEQLSERAKECLRNEQEANFAGFAQLWGMRHLVISRADEFDGLDWEADGAPILLELRPDELQTGEFWRAWEAK